MSKACEASCELSGQSLRCRLDAGHPYEHEDQDCSIFAYDVETPIIVWWADDGHAFVGSDRAVDTGNIGGPRFEQVSS